ARHLPMMRVVPAESSFDGQSRRHHRPVDVERDALQPQPLDDLGDQFAVERMQRRSHLTHAPAQPATERAVTRQDGEPTEALDHWITDEMTDMPQPARSDHQHREDQAHHRHRREVPARISSPQMASQPSRELDALQELTHQFQSRERGQSLAAESKREIPVDTGTQVSFSLSHSSWPFGRSEERLEHPLQTTPRGPIQAE